MPVTLDCQFRKLSQDEFGDVAYEVMGHIFDIHRDFGPLYLLLTESSHGKLVNLRPGSVEHDFVNTTLTLRDRTAFEIDDAEWDATSVKMSGLKQFFLGFLRDLGAGLDLALYEEAITCFLGGEDAVNKLVEVVSGRQPIGMQPMRCAAPGVAFRLTALPRDSLPCVDDYLCRLVQHTTLESMLWINVTRPVVTFRTLRPRPGR